jgi:hypothetical protein
MISIGLEDLETETTFHIIPDPDRSPDLNIKLGKGKNEDDFIFRSININAGLRQEF